MYEPILLHSIVFMMDYVHRLGKEVGGAGGLLQRNRSP